MCVWVGDVVTYYVSFHMLMPVVRVTTNNWTAGSLLLNLTVMNNFSRVSRIP